MWTLSPTPCGEKNERPPRIKRSPLCGVFFPKEPPGAPHLFFFLAPKGRRDDKQILLLYCRHTTTTRCPSLIKETAHGLCQQLISLPCPTKNIWLCLVRDGSPPPPPAACAAVKNEKQSFAFLKRRNAVAAPTQKLCASSLVASTRPKREVVR